MALLAVGVLLALMIGVRLFGDLLVPGDADTRTTLLAVGFIMLVAYSTGEFFRRVKLPALLGYLVAGILFGPKLAAMVLGPDSALFSEQVVSRLALINTLTIGVIGTMGGGELRVAELKQNLKPIAAIIGVCLFIVMPLTVGVVLGLSYAWPEVISFLDQASFSSRLGAALMLGVLAMGMSPSATLALIQESRAKGSFTSLVLGAVVALDLVLVALFLVALALTKLLVSPEGFSMAAMLAVLPGIAAEFGWALVIGLATGSVLILYLRFVHREVLFFSIGIIFAAAYVCQALHAETLLAFLTAGFVVQNFSKQGHALIHAFERISLPVFVVYFTSQAIQLDLAALSAYLPLTLILVGVRFLQHYYGFRWVGRRFVRDARTGPLLWMAFLSRGGVDLVLAGLVAAAIPTWGADFQVISMAVVVVFIVAGPPFLKYALDQAGETEDTQAKPADLETSISVLPVTPSSEGPVDPLPVPESEDPALNARLVALHGALVQLDESSLRSPVVLFSNQTTQTLRSLELQWTKILESAQRAVALESNEARNSALEDASRQWRERASAVAQGWLRQAPTPLHADAMSELFARLTELEEFSTEYRIIREPHLFEGDPGDGRWVHVIKGWRRLRKRLLGPGTRNLPLGRLWRFYVAMGIPRELAKINPPEPPWRGFSELLELTQKVFEALISASDSVACRAKLQELDPKVRASMEAQLARQGQLHLQLGHDTAKAVERAYRAFLGALRVAGGAELPARRYRPSRIFDRVRRAQEAWLARLRKLEVSARASRDATLTRAVLAGFRITFGAAEQRALGTLERLLGGRVVAALQELAELLQQVGQQGRGERTWGEILTATLHPSLAVAQSAFEVTIQRASAGTLLRGPLREMERALEVLPELALLEENSAPMPLREWIKNELTTDRALLAIEANERLVAVLRRGLTELEKVDQVVEYHLLAVRPPGAVMVPDETAKGGLERATRLVRQLLVRLAESAEELRTSWRADNERLWAEAVPPVEERRWPELQRRMVRWSSNDPSPAQSWWGSIWAPVGRALIWASAKLLPWLGSAGRDFRLWWQENPSTRARNARAIFFEAEHPRQRLPVAYRRLFSTGPLELAELHVTRPETARLEATLQAWKRGAPRSILVRGDPGVGKRSLVRRCFDDQHELQVRSIRVAPGASLLPTLQATLTAGEAEAATALGADRASVARLLRAKDERLVVIVEDAGQLFLRREADWEALDQFLELIRTTSDLVLWVVLLDTPLARLLETTHHVPAFFSDVIDLPPLSPPILTELLLIRHRLSGFELEYEKRSTRLLDLLRNPNRLIRLRQEPGTQFWAELVAQSGGNPRQALAYWLWAARVDQSGTRIRLAPLPDTPSDLLADTEPEVWPILAALARHGTLSEPQLLEILGDRAESLHQRVAVLTSTGLIDEPPNAPGRWRLHPVFFRKILRALEQRRAA